MTKACEKRRDVSLPADAKESKDVTPLIRPIAVQRRGCLVSSREERSYDNIVLNIPHASVGGLGVAKWNNKVALMKEVRKWTDWFTDVIFVPDNRPGIKSVVADYSRFVVDVERLLDDPMNEIGQGIIYTKFNGLQRTISDEEHMGMMAYYYSYIKQLKSMLNEHSLLIDCHSFPSGLSDVDVCIGVSDDWSCPSEFLIELVMESFRQAGYKVALNTPFSNTIAPPMNFRYDSIMIELNKRIYLNEDSLELLDSARSLKNSLNTLYGVLLRYEEEL
jgi:N-formylglutamate amidohydrolase